MICRSHWFRRIPGNSFENGGSTDISFEFRATSCTGKVQLIPVDRELLDKHFQSFVVGRRRKVAHADATRRGWSNDILIDKTNHSLDYPKDSLWVPQGESRPDVRPPIVPNHDLKNRPSPTVSQVSFDSDSQLCGPE